MRLSESAEVGCAQLRRRHTLAIHGSQSRRDVLSLNGLSSAQPMLLVQRHQGARGEWFARQQFIGRMHFDARFVVHNDQFCFVEIEHFAKLFCDLQLKHPLLCEERLLVSDPNQFLWIGLDMTPHGNRQAKRRCA